MSENHSIFLASKHGYSDFKTLMRTKESENSLRGENLTQDHLQDYRKSILMFR